MTTLNAAQREQLDGEGYLVVEDVLDPERAIAPLLDEYADVLDRAARSFQSQGLLRDSYAGLPFTERLIQVTRESGRSLSQHFDISLPQAGIQPHTPMHHGPAAFALLTDPSLLDMVEGIVGQEIYSNPVQHIRMKLPAGAVSSANSDGLNAKIP